MKTSVGIATIGAFLIGDCTAVAQCALFYSIGRIFQSYV